MTDLAVVSAEDAGEGAPDERVVSIAGEIDLSNARDVLDAVTRLVPEEARRVIVDLSAVDYLDSAAIAMLFRLAETLVRRRQELRLVVPESSPIRVVVDLTGLARVVPVADALTSRGTAR